MSKEYNDRHLKPLRAAYQWSAPSLPWRELAPRPGTSNHNAEFPRLDVKR